MDLAAIEAAHRFPSAALSCSTVGRRERYKRMDTATVVRFTLDPALQLAVVRDGSAYETLLADAADLRVSSHLNFVGSFATAQLHRQLRTARVVVALPEQEPAGLRVTQSLVPARRSPTQTFRSLPHRLPATPGGGSCLREAPHLKLRMGSARRRDSASRNRGACSSSPGTRRLNARWRLTRGRSAGSRG